MKRLVFGLCSLQVICTTALISLVAYAFNFTPAQSLVIGTALSLSSTAIVIQLYSDDKRLGSQSGRTSFAILLFQDLAVIPILLMVDVHVFALQSAGDLLDGGAPLLRLHVECGSGTYVRSLVRDLGELLGCGAHVAELRRLWVDPFRDPRMWTIEALEALAAPMRKNGYGQYLERVLRDTVFR
jgi:hypothetical protein